jgi:hypothetical protein
MRSLAALLGVAAVAAVTCAAAQEQAPFADLLAAANQQVSTECERALDTRNTSSALVEREARMNAAVFCDCMPPALAELGRGRAASTLVSADEFGALVLREFDACGARAVRDTSRQDCAALAPADAPPTYCECFAAGVDELTDEQIVSDSIAVRDNLTRRAEARRRGTVEPPLQQGLLASIDERCRRPEPTQ